MSKKFIHVRTLPPRARGMDFAEPDDTGRQGSLWCSEKEKGELRRKRCCTLAATSH